MSIKAAHTHLASQSVDPFKIIEGGLHHPRSETRYAVGDTDMRPWGRWEVLAVGPHYAVKRIYVHAGGRLSLQYHHHRSEHWTIVEGIGEVWIGDENRTVKPGDHLYIPVTVAHRIRNAGHDPLVFVEVQTGPILDESDIIRISDDYSR